MTGIMSPGRKAQHTAKWARIMTKWLVKYAGLDLTIRPVQLLGTTSGGRRG